MGGTDPMTDYEEKISRVLHAYRKEYPDASMDEKEIAEAIGLDPADTRVHRERMRSPGWVQRTRFGVMEVRVRVSLTRGNTDSRSHRGKSVYRVVKRPRISVAAATGICSPSPGGVCRNVGVHRRSLLSDTASVRGCRHSP